MNLCCLLATDLPELLGQGRRIAQLQTGVIKGGKGQKETGSRGVGKIPVELINKMYRKGEPREMGKS